MKTVFIWSYLPGTKEWLFDAPWLFALGIVIQWLFLLCSFAGWRLLRNKSPGIESALSAYALYTIAALFPFYAESRFLLPVYIWALGFAWYWFYHRRPWPASLLKSLGGVRLQTQ